MLFRLPTSDFRLPTSDFRLPTSDFRLPTSDFRLPTSIECVKNVYSPLAIGCCCVMQ
jgi:hypothetical protein